MPQELKLNDESSYGAGLGVFVTPSILIDEGGHVILSDQDIERIVVAILVRLHPSIKDRR